MGLGIQWDWGTLGRTERDGARDTMGLGHNGTGLGIHIAPSNLSGVFDPL